MTTTTEKLAEALRFITEVHSGHTSSDDWLAIDGTAQERAREALAAYDAQHVTATTTGRIDVLAVQMTELRIKWLAHLAQHGETPWSRMPKSDKAANRFARVKRAATNLTWRPMVEAGLITSRFGQRNTREQPDHLFAITDAGRAALARVGGAK